MRIAVLMRKRTRGFVQSWHRSEHSWALSPNIVDNGDGITCMYLRVTDRWQSDVVRLVLHANAKRTAL